MKTCDRCKKQFEDLTLCQQCDRNLCAPCTEAQQCSPVYVTVGDGFINWGVVEMLWEDAHNETLWNEKMAELRAEMLQVLGSRVKKEVE